MAYLDQSPGAQLIFRIGTIGFRCSSSRSWQDQSIWRRRFPFAVRVTFNMEAWTEDGLRYVVIGDADPERYSAKLSELLKMASK